MLIERKGVKDNDIVTFRIVSGEEIVGKLVSYKDSNSVITINKPVIVAMQMMGPQQASLGFLPFIAAAGDEFTITFNSNSIVTHPIRAREDVTKGYINATSSVVIPTAQQAGLILGS